jgi:carbonic anhydrase
VLHLMHETSDGNVAGVAVFLKAGKGNAAIQEIWDHMPSAEGQNSTLSRRRAAAATAQRANCEGKPMSLLGNE